MAKQMLIAALLVIAGSATAATSANAAALVAPNAVPATNNNVAAASAAELAGFKVCGNFCGPGWCANSHTPEKTCVTSGKWARMKSNSAVDGCCRAHDNCCGVGNRAVCNKQIVSCVQSNKAAWGPCGIAVWGYMASTANWCCGSRCPTYINPDVPLSLAGKVFSDGRVRVSFAAEESENTAAVFTVEAVAPVDVAAEAAFAALANGGGWNAPPSEGEEEGGDAVRSGVRPAPPKLRLATPELPEASLCAAAPYALTVDGHSKMVHVNLFGASSSSADSSPADSTSAAAASCGAALMAATPRHAAHPLLDAPETILYWPEADIIAVNDKAGGVLEIPRIQ